MKDKKFWIFVYFISLIIIGSLGYYIIGGNDWTLLDSLYMTIITLASVGYGEVHVLDNYGKIWSILLIIFGVTGVGVLFRTINEEFIQSQRFWKKKMKKTISKLKNHHIICGYGRMGAVIAKELKDKNQKFLIIEKNEEKVEQIRDNDMLCLQGDATSEKTLKSANIDKASGIAVVLKTDQDNLFVTMTIKTIYPEIFLLSRCAKEDNQSKLIRAGANKVINPYISGGHRMAEILIKPQVEDSISVVSPKNSKMNLTIDEISLNDVQKYDSVTIKESRIREKFGISIVGIMDDNGKSIINPLSDQILRSNQTIILIGDVHKMNKFKEELP
ncbi:MAG: hypothetical protein CMG57_08460 [Candidatus Marinimicrobia bacterium]|nr:hypothetical protein [Candidatus Neomarinimicrobiota bacterium]